MRDRHVVVGMRRTSKAASNTSLLSFSKDGLTCGLDIGRRFSEMWSGAVEVAYEPAKGGLPSPLGPTNG